jgi:hypothetical protein
MPFHVDIPESVARPVLLKVYISGGIYAQPFLNERLHVTRGGYL